jgi:aspartate 4-decarboxylase
MFSLYEFMDANKEYQNACLQIVHRRVMAMIEGMGLQLSPNPNFDAYYGLIDFEFWARKNIGDEAVEYLKKNIHPLDLAFRLAEAHGIVLPRFLSTSLMCKILFADRPTFILLTAKA